MITFALDLSSEVGSIAMLEDGQLLGQEELLRAQNRTTPLMEAIDGLRRSVGLEWESVDLFAAGSGPGRYAGLRVAVTTVQHLALPDQRPVRVVPSGAALAVSVAAQSREVERILVIGDARRDRIWCGEFLVMDPVLEQVGDWRLIELADVPATFAQSADQGRTHIISSEWERLQPLLESIAAWESDQWEHSAGWPSAEWIARLAEHEEQVGLPRAPLSPIYLHPPVAKANQ